MTIMDFNQMPAEQKRAQLLKCCGSSAWVEKMLAAPPAEDLIDLFQNAEQNWYECSETDWREAFDHHPQIGDVKTVKVDSGSGDWAKNEQSKVSDAADGIKRQLAEANQLYKQKFGYIFIINATGKTAEEILAALQVRLQNSPEAEMENAMSQQLGITRLRLEKLLQET